jgi:6-pyruvoyltetrahydropterin/6-carboxytetrahydropterin synthase
MGHRVVGHENKCKHLHGHNYRVTFYVAQRKDVLDTVGRVVDFSVIKQKLCMWLEENWDHKMVLWTLDPALPVLKAHFPDDIVSVPFNPTAENIAKYLLEDVAPRQLLGSDLYLHECKVQETRKCSATFGY